MADWLKNVVEEVTRQFNDLPEWKRSEDEYVSARCIEEERAQAAICEPKQEF